MQTRGAAPAAILPCIHPFDGLRWPPGVPMSEKPALRADIQMVLTLVEGRRMVVFQDPYDLAAQRIAVDAGALPLLQMLDGRHEIRDIQRELTNRSGGRLVTLLDIEAFLGSLDRAFLLNSASFRLEMDSLFTAFSR